MIILDENILEGQRLLLQAWRLAAKQIGLDIGRKGLKDGEIVVLLKRQRNATFFTRDGDFFDPHLLHPDFNAQTKRAGRVVRISHTGLTFWRLRSQARTQFPWKLTR